MRLRRSVLARGVVGIGCVGGLASLCACTAILGIDELADTDASLDAEATARDGGAVDATIAADAGPGADATVADATATDGSAVDAEVARTISVVQQAAVVPITPLGALYGADLRFGEALAFSPDGTWLAIGAPGAARSDSDAGATGQVQLVSISLPPDQAGTLVLSLLDPGQAQAVAGGSFGRSVAFSPDGRYLAVGAPQEPHAPAVITGDVYLYALTSSGWSYQTTLQPGDHSATWFGNTVAFNAPSFPTPPPNDVLFVAATGDATEGDAGTSMTYASVSAYLLTDDGTDGGVDAAAFGTIISPSLQDGFGWSLAVSADTRVVLIGAPFTNYGNYQQGVVYATPLATLMQPGAVANQLYPFAYTVFPGALVGYSVALSVGGSEALIGAPRDGGAVASLEMDADAPPSFGTALAGFTDPTLDGGRFGESVVVNTQQAIIGNPARNDGVCLTVSQPIFQKAVSTLADVPDPLPDAGSRYGATLATTFDGGFVAVAAPGTQGTPPPVVYLTR